MKTKTDNELRVSRQGRQTATQCLRAGKQSHKTTESPWEARSESGLLPFSLAPAPAGERFSWRAHFQFPFLLAYLLSSMLVIAAARGDLWLDEIWSVNFARSATQALDLFRIRHDNSHLLNTLYLYFMRHQTTFLPYRLFAVLSGIGTVILIGHVTRRDWGTRVSLCSLVLAGTSYPMILYFSEARGYAPAMFFAVLAYATLRHNMISLRYRKLLLFWTASVLGFLSHLTFAIVSVSFLLMNLVFTLRMEGSTRRRIVGLLAHQIPPFVFFAGWYFFFVRGMEIGGGPVYGSSLHRVGKLGDAVPQTPWDLAHWSPRRI